MSTVAADPLEYADAIRRLVRDHVDNSSTSREDIIRDLIGSGNPDDDRLRDRNLAEFFVSGMVTEELVASELDATGSLPSGRADIESAASGTDQAQVSPKDHQRAVIDSVEDEVVTLEDLGAEVPRTDTEEPVFREDLEDAAERAESGKDIGYLGQDREEVVDALAEERGAPSRETFEQTARDTLVQEQREVTEDTPGYSGSGEKVSVVRSESGDVVGVLGSQAAAGAVAEEEGAEVLTGGTDSFGLNQESGRAELTIDGEPVREVEL